MLTPLTGGGSMAWGGASPVVTGLSAGDTGIDGTSDVAVFGEAAVTGSGAGASMEAVAGSAGSLSDLPPP